MGAHGVDRLHLRSNARLRRRHSSEFPWGISTVPTHCLNPFPDVSHVINPLLMQVNSAGQPQNLAPWTVRRC